MILIFKKLAIENKNKWLFTVIYSSLHSNTSCLSIYFSTHCRYHFRHTSFDVPFTPQTFAFFVLQKKINNQSIVCNISIQTYFTTSLTGKGNSTWIILWHCRTGCTVTVTGREMTTSTST